VPAWFAGGLRIVDIADPVQPEEIGFFIPSPSPASSTRKPTMWTWMIAA